MSQTTRGGGNHKTPVIETAKLVFAFVPFTCTQAMELVSGFTRSICADLEQTGIIHAVSGPIKQYSHYPKYYQFSDKDDTHKLTDKEKWKRAKQNAEAERDNHEMGI